MVRYENLPIYKQILQMTVHFEQRRCRLSLQVGAKTYRASPLPSWAGRPAPSELQHPQPSPFLKRQEI